MTGARSVTLTLTQHGTEITIAVIEMSAPPEQALRIYQPSRAVKWLILRVVSQMANAHSDTVEFVKHEGTHMLSFTYPARAGNSMMGRRAGK